MKNFVQKLFKVKHFSVYPNPATKGKVVNLTVKNAGNYSDGCIVEMLAS